MKDLILILASQGFALGIGWAFVSLILARNDNRIGRLEMAALSYVIGMGCIGLSMMSFYLLRIPFSMMTFYCPLAGIALVCIFFYGASGRIAPAVGGTAPKPLSTIDVFFIAGIVFGIAYSFFSALIKPMESYDGVGAFAIKAKIFFLARGIPADYFSTIANNFPHPAYPYMVPLQEAFGFMSMGSFNDLLVKIVFPLHLAAFLVLFYCGIKAFTNRRSALMATFLLSSMYEFNRFAALGYTDTHFALYLVIGFLFWYRAIAQGKINAPLVVISGILGAFSYFTKDIGIIAPAAVFILALVYAFQTRSFKGGVWLLFLYGAAFVLAASPWLLTKASAGLTQPFITHKTFDVGVMAPLAVRRVVPVLYEFQTHVFNPKEWNLLWPVFFILFIINWRVLFTAGFRYISIFILVTLAAYGLFYLTVDTVIYGDYGAYAESLKAGMNRHLISVAPLALIWLAVLFKDMTHE
ncbi:MAG: glycosyltransferase family 39 protein [Candidatus Omnitrophica bacterium]|nr:glycosyltransferase family 39 protein [Candidatus Omnitrophota bacterium]